MSDPRDNKNDPPPSKGTNEPWEKPGQASQDPNTNYDRKPDLDKWADVVKKHGN